MCFCSSAFWFDIFLFCILLQVPLGVFPCFSSAVLLRSKSINVSEFSIALNLDRSCYPHDTKKAVSQAPKNTQHHPKITAFTIHKALMFLTGKWNTIPKWTWLSSKNVQETFSSWSSLVVFAVLVLGTYWVSPSLECLTHQARNLKHDKPAVRSCCWSIMIIHCQRVKFSKKSFTFLITVLWGIKSFKGKYFKMLQHVLIP